MNLYNKHLDAVLSDHLSDSTTNNFKTLTYQFTLPKDSKSDLPEVTELKEVFIKGIYSALLTPYTLKRVAAYLEFQSFFRTPVPQIE